jgi:hypothetical protein
MVRVKEEKYEINSLSTGITETDGSGLLWKDIWDYKVPLNQHIALNPHDQFCAYLVGDDTNEMPRQTRVRVVHRDVANEDSEPVMSEVPYQQVKEFTDKNLIMHLTLGKPMAIGPEEHVVVQVSGYDSSGGPGDLDASASYFKLLTVKMRPGL